MGLIDEMLDSVGCDEIGERIWELHKEGLAPSEIAETAGVTAQRVREEVVARWRADKEEHQRRSASTRG